jgi:ubiquinone/menaquinone biosynthesis C-methylase UbiE
MRIMHKTIEEIYRDRKQFFNDRAGEWLDMCYKNPDSGQLDLHQKNFERLFALVPLKLGDHVMDVGCGSGVLVRMILDRIGSTGIVYELDFAEKMIEENRKLHKEKNIRFIVADVAQAPIEAESCNVIFCFSCFPHFDQKQEVLTSLAHILRSGGTLVLAHFNSAEEINQRHESCPAVMHDHLPEQASMRRLLEGAALQVDQFIDESGFYCILAKK